VRDLIRKILLVVSSVVLFLFPIGICHAELFGNYYGSVDFPGGISSLADAAVSYTVGSGGVTSEFMDTSKALGAPDYWGGYEYVSLGEGGSITLAFTDNSLTGNGNSGADLWIFEVGPAVERTFVDISSNGTDWFSVGLVAGTTSGIDIDYYGFGIGDYFSYVRLTDDLSQNYGNGATAGADIDAVGAISTAPPVNPVPEPATLFLLGVGIAGLLGVRMYKK